MSFLGTVKAISMSSDLLIDASSDHRQRLCFSLFLDAELLGFSSGFFLTSSREIECVNIEKDNGTLRNA